MVASERWRLPSLPSRLPSETRADLPFRRGESDHQTNARQSPGEPSALHRRRVGDAGSHHFSTFTMWAMTSAAMRRAIADCSIMVILAHRLVGSVSVGLNAVALVNARYR